MKLKRYGLGSAALCRMDSAAIKGPDIVEKPDGEYYKASEVDAYLAAIGAGGVSGRVTQKTLEQHRVEFLEHWDYIHGHGLDGGWEAVAWAAWKAARGITK